MLAAWAVCCAGAAIADPPPHAEWELTFQDEFEGDSVNWEVWESQNSIRGGEKPEGRWPENNVVTDGLLKQMTRREDPPRGGKEWSSAHIWTRQFAQQYGYFEARLKYGKYLNNAFWLYRPRGARFPDPPHFEIDVNEGHTPREVAMTLHYFTYDDDPKGEMWSTGKRWDAPVDLDEDFYTYAVEWDKELIVWYYDGEPVRALKNPSAHAPVDIRLSTVIMEHALQRDGVAIDTMDGVTMEIDWVRVYRKTKDLVEPTRPEIEVHQRPMVVETEPRVAAGEPRAVVLAESFATEGGLPRPWEVGDGAPLVAEGPEGRSALRLGAGDYVFCMLDEGIEGQLAVELDCYHSSNGDGLLLVTLGSFDRADEERRKSSYYTGDIGPYIHWYARRFLSFYTETDKWTHIGRWKPGEWASHRFVLDVGEGAFDCYASAGEFIGSGVFRHRQKAARGIGLRHRGQGDPVWVSNVRVVELEAEGR